MDEDAPLELTVEMVVVSGLRRGIAIQDWENLTFGMIIDLIVTFINSMEDDEDEAEHVRTAGQADFDCF